MSDSADSADFADFADFAVVFRGFDREKVSQHINILNEIIEQQRIDCELAQAEVAECKQRIERLVEEVQGLSDGVDATQDFSAFQEIIRVAEEQATQLSANAVKQADRLLEEVKVKIHKDLQEAENEAHRVIENAQYRAEQIVLRVDTEVEAQQLAADERLRQADEQVLQAEREAAVMRSEAERLAALTRSQAATESDELRGDAARILHEARLRQEELDIGTKRKYDDAQQEFLRLHNDAVAHAHRITSDANEAVSSAIVHAQYIGEQNKLSEELAKTESIRIVSEAKRQAQLILQDARSQTSELVSVVRAHTKNILLDAEERTRALRFQQHQMNSFVGEVESILGRELVAGLTVDEIIDAATAEKTNITPKNISRLPGGDEGILGLNVQHESESVEEELSEE
jgi:cell division septum initiation protein DivIVA